MNCRWCAAAPGTGVQVLDDEPLQCPHQQPPLREAARLPAQLGGAGAPDCGVDLGFPHDLLGAEVLPSRTIA